MDEDLASGHGYKYMPRLLSTGDNVRDEADNFRLSIPYIGNAGDRIATGSQ